VTDIVKIHKLWQTFIKDVPYKLLSLSNRRMGSSKF